MSLSVMPDIADEYRRLAQECLEAADRMHNEEERKILLHIAQTSQAEHGPRAAKSPD
jgi:hypothetical protein